MELDNCIKERRSVRDFLDKEVNWGTLFEILESTTYAPSSGNMQNWAFIIVRDKKKKEALAQAANGQDFMIKAPVLIVICNRLDRIKRIYGERGEKLYSIQNCAAATQNILLKAHSLGLSTCWVGAFDSDEVTNILKLEKEVQPDSIIALGYSEENPIMPKREELGNLVYFEDWGNKRKVLEVKEEAKKIIKDNFNKIKNKFKK